MFAGQHPRFPRLCRRSRPRWRPGADVGTGVGSVTALGKRREPGLLAARDRTALHHRCAQGGAELVRPACGCGRLVPDQRRRRGQAHPLPQRHRHPLPLSRTAQQRTGNPPKVQPPDRGRARPLGRARPQCQKTPRPGDSELADRPHPAAKPTRAARFAARQGRQGTLRDAVATAARHPAQLLAAGAAAAVPVPGPRARQAD